MKNILTPTIIAATLFVQCDKKPDAVTQKMPEISTKTAPLQPIKIEMMSLSTTEIPKNLAHQGKIQFAKTLTDTLGKHTILYCLTGKMQSKKSETGEPENDTFLYIYDYLETENGYKLNWKIQDEVRNCMFDLEMGFVDNAITATDLDHNNLAEIWNMYHLTCTSDVSPEDLKIIMYEGQKKYAVRGYEFVQYPSDEGTTTAGGTYKMDEAFAKAPKEFRDFAKDLWQKNKKLRTY